MVSKKSKIVCSVKVCRLKLVSLPFADQLQPNFFKLPCLEQKITKVNWKSTLYNTVNCLWIFIFILFYLIFCLFLLLFIYTVKIKYWQILFITSEQKGKYHSATSTFKCWGSSAAVLVYNYCLDVLLPTLDHYWRSSHTLLILITMFCLCLIWRSQGAS